MATINDSTIHAGLLEKGFNFSFMLIVRIKPHGMSYIRYRTSVNGLLATEMYVAVSGMPYIFKGD